MAELTEGVKAPDFKLETDTGESLKLSSLKGKNVVLYFYPKSDTPGCTTQACGLRDEFPKFGKLDAVILGVSPDPVQKQAKFKEKYDLPFTILADVDKEVAQAYGVWVEKSMYGRKYMGNERTTFIIGKDGKIAKIFWKVKPAEHTKLVVDALKSL